MFDDDVWRHLPLGPAPTLALAVVGLVAAVYVTVSRARLARTAAAAILVASVMVVLVVTARGSLSNPDGEFSWKLGESIRAELGNLNQALGLLNVFGNVALFVPVGWMVAVLVSRRAVVAGVSSALALSVVVEVGQVLAGSYGDVDDLVLNALGGLVGAVVSVVLRSLRRGPEAGAAASVPSGSDA